MTVPKPESSPHLADLIRRRKGGFSLEREFFLSEEVYRLDIDRIWRASWLFAGHTCQIPQPGDYFTYEVDGDSILVLRGDDAKIRAFHNVCRHRGTLLCAEDSGKAGRIVCPYHQWTYGRDGRLLSARGMQEDIDKSGLSLLSVHLRE